jgi:Uma2 family endonuclease
MQSPQDRDGVLEETPHPHPGHTQLQLFFSYLSGWLIEDHGIWEVVR